MKKSNVTFLLITLILTVCLISCASPRPKLKAEDVKPALKVENKIGTPVTNGKVLTVKPEEASDVNREELHAYYQALKEKRPILIEYYTPLCGACKKLQPVIDELKNKWGDKVTFVKIDLSDESLQATAADQNIRFVPTLQFIGKDGILKNTLVGVQSKEALEEQLKKITK